MGTTIPITPGHPSRIIKMMAIPTNAKGNTKEAKKIGIFNSIMLKSLESIFTTFEISEILSVNWEIFESLANKT